MFTKPEEVIKEAGGTFEHRQLVFQLNEMILKLEDFAQQN